MKTQARLSQILKAYRPPVHDDVDEQHRRYYRSLRASKLSEFQDFCKACPAMVYLPVFAFGMVVLATAYFLIWGWPSV